MCYLRTDIHHQHQNEKESALKKNIGWVSAHDLKFLLTLTKSIKPPPVFFHLNIFLREKSVMENQIVQKIK